MAQPLAHGPGKIDCWLARWRYPIALIVGLLFALATMAVPAGCAASLTPPAAPADPVAVYLVDHGRTPSLVLPAGEGVSVRYVYGEWQWYALNREGPGRAVAALLWPTRGTLGRQYLPGPATLESVQEEMQLPTSAIHELLVERERAQRLRQRLDADFENSAHSLVINERRGLSFVPHPHNYTYFWNSNHAVASWLRELDVEVRGPTFVSNWNVRPPPTPGRVHAIPVDP
jgi:hypothetical protein